MQSFTCMLTLFKTRSHNREFEYSRVCIIFSPLNFFTVRFFFEFSGLQKISFQGF